MIVLTDAGRKMLRTAIFARNAQHFHIDYHATVCSSARGYFTLNTNQPEENDVAFTDSGYTFYVDRELMMQAEAIIIDATGDIPVISSRKAVH